MPGRISKPRARWNCMGRRTSPAPESWCPHQSLHKRVAEFRPKQPPTSNPSGLLERPRKKTQWLHPWLHRPNPERTRPQTWHCRPPTEGRPVASQVPHKLPQCQELGTCGGSSGSASRTRRCPSTGRRSLAASESVRRRPRSCPGPTADTAEPSGLQEPPRPRTSRSRTRSRSIAERSRRTGCPANRSRRGRAARAGGRSWAGASPKRSSRARCRPSRSTSERGSQPSVS
mmetsp:Transcript_34676/g.73852  ORF Transcript_34676/g.73852 Transcript_34676/m.73852 type:complete len:230 (+) Transcript_34676:508-1197(+)